MIHILFIINLSSGTQQVDYESIIRSYYEDHASVQLHFLYPTAWMQAVQDIQHFIQHNNIDIAVAVGGDGTVNAVAQAIYGLPIKLGIIPAGSSNGLAKELKIPDNIEAILHAILQGHTQLISSITINELFSIHLSDIGFNAALIKQFKHNTIRGLKGYFKAGMKVLFKHKHNTVNIQIGDNTYIYDAIMVVIANASMYGTGLTINPLCNYEDQQFEIIIIKRISLIELFKMAFNNWIPNTQKTVIHQVDAVSISTHEPAHFQIDGEYIGKSKYIHAHINPLYIQVIIPA